MNLIMLYDIKMSQEDFNEIINEFIKPRFYLKGSIELESKNTDSIELNIDLNEVKIKKIDKVITHTYGQRNKKLF